MKHDIHVSRITPVPVEQSRFCDGVCLWAKVCVVLDDDTVFYDLSLIGDSHLHRFHVVSLPPPSPHHDYFDYPAMPVQFCGALWDEILEAVLSSPLLPPTLFFIPEDSLSAE